MRTQTMPQHLATSSPLVAINGSALPWPFVFGLWSLVASVSSCLTHPSFVSHLASPIGPLCLILPNFGYTKELVRVTHSEKLWEMWHEKHGFGPRSRQLLSPE